MTIFEKLGAVQAALKAPKNQFNKFGGYKCSKKRIIKLLYKNRN